MAKLRKRPENENPVHVIKKIGTSGGVYIERTKPPIIKIFYDPVAKAAVLEYVDPNCEMDAAEAAFKKALAWAKHNIKT